MLQGGGGEVLPNEWCPLAARDDLTALHVRPTEARLIHDPALWNILDDQVNSPLSAPGRRGGRRQTHHILAGPAKHLVGDIGLCQNHHIAIYELERLNRLDKAKSLTVVYVIHPKVQPTGHGSLWCGGGGAVWRCSLPWKRGRVKQMGIFTAAESDSNQSC